MATRTSEIALALVLWGAPLYAADTKNIDRTLPLSALGAVTLDAHNGSIQIRTWDRAEVEIHVRIERRRVSTYSRHRFNETTVQIDGSPDLVSIQTKMPYGDDWAWWFSWGEWDSSPAIQYTITAPRAAQWRIRNHNGSVTAANLGGPLDLSMHNGRAQIDFASFTRDSRIQTHNGTVELALPASSRFQFHSNGHNMHLNSDFPVTTQSFEHGRHDVDGQVNGGGPELRLTAHNGGFRLRSK